MTREQLEHIIRAAAAIVNFDEIVVIGSQSMLGALPRPPSSPILTRSMEADVFTFRDQEDATVIDGAIGEGSVFHNTFGYYAHGVGEESAILPPGWKDRLVRVQSPSTRNAAGLCLDLYDLAASKLAAGRDVDFEFVGEMLAHKVVSRAALAQRAASLPAPYAALASDRLRRLG